MKWIALVFSLVLCSFSVFSKSYVEWKQGDNIDVPVYFEEKGEKRIVFDEPVKLGVSPRFKEHYRAEIIDTVVYLSTLKPTEDKFRVLAKGVKTNNTYVFTVFNTDLQSDSEELVIKREEQSKKRGSTNTYRNPFDKNPVTPIQLARFASQNLYAPKHAIEVTPGITRASLSLPDDMDFIYAGSMLDISPLVAYEGGGHTITAFKIANKHPNERVVVNIERLFGRVNAISAFSQHRSLGVREENKVSVLYVITKGTLASNLVIGR